MYFNFISKSTSQSKLKDNVDIRIIPYFYLGYNFNFNRFGISFELPIGTSISITRGTLVNNKVGIERTYSSAEYLWHYGIGLSTKYRVNDNNKIGFYGFSHWLESVRQEI
jgi:hypothetical protein